MRCRKAYRLLAERSGASLLFVLAVMFLLMAIGASAMAAASANAGVNNIKQEQNQLNLYNDSMERTIKFGLDGITDDGGKLISSTTLSLGGQILREVYRDTPKNDNGYYPVNISFTFSEVTVGDATFVVTITGEFFVAFTAFVAYAPPDPLDDVYAYDPVYDENVLVMSRGEITEEVEHVMQEARINGNITVQVKTDDRIISQTVYQYSGGYIKEANCQWNDGVDGWTPAEDDMEIAIPGSWRFISHEKIDI